MTRDLDGVDVTLPAARRADLVRHLRSRRHATVYGLARVFGVSRDTIRRDLDYLNEHGLVTRTHGGAVIAQDLIGLTQPFSRRRGQHVEAKDRIARLAASLVADGETILISGGTTTLAVGMVLGERRELTIVTNNLPLPRELPPECYRSVYVLGGQYRPESLSTFGGLQLPGVHGISADRAIVGCGGLGPAGLSVAAPEDASIVFEMLRAARQRVLVVDSSKFNRDAFAHAAALTDIQSLVTDAEPDRPLREALEKAGVEVLVAP